MDHKIKILVVDDEKAFTEVLKLTLEETGRFEVYIENDPCMAVQSALKIFPDIILLDIIMPDIEGPDVLAMFRSEPLLRNVPVIFLTATIRKDEVDAQQGLVGGHVFLAKPCTVEELISTIDAQI